MAELDDPARDAVEKITVVRHEQATAPVLREKVLDPLHRIDVEMVGRLVEQQQVAREGDAAHLASGKLMAAPVRLPGEIQFLQHGAELGFEVPAVVNHQLMVDLRVLGRVDRDGFELFLQFAEIREPVRDVFADGPSVVHFKILRQHGDPQIAGPRDVP